MKGSQPVAIGFLTVVQHAQHGLFGGYLLLAPNGRPIEFHCTAPLKANRAQEILFGPTLEPYLYGEQIGCALLEKAEAKTLAVCTDLPAMMAVREHTDLPVALVVAQHENAADAGQLRIRFDSAHHLLSDGTHWLLGANRLQTVRGYERDRGAIESALASIVERVSLAEPFGRIREAIDEAQRSGR